MNTVELPVKNKNYQFIYQENWARLKDKLFTKPGKYLVITAQPQWYDFHSDDVPPNKPGHTCFLIKANTGEKPVFSAMPSLLKDLVMRGAALDEFISVILVNAPESLTEKKPGMLQASFFVSAYNAFTEIWKKKTD